MLEEFARVLGHVLNLKESGRKDEGLTTIRAAYKTWFDLEAAHLLTLTPEELILFIHNRDDFPAEKTEALAKAFMLEADLLLTTDTAALHRRRQALQLFLYLEKTDTTTFSLPRRQAITGLKNALGEV